MHLALLFCLALGTTTAATATSFPTNRALCTAVNQYRAEGGLAPLPLSTALMYVAEVHRRDLNAAPPVAPCDRHSWQHNEPFYSGCCFSDPVADGACMWNKPAELTRHWNFSYGAPAFEISAYGCHSIDCALGAWRASPFHDAVLLTRDFGAVGCAHSGGGNGGLHSVVWFGRAPPVRRYVDACSFKEKFVPVPNDSGGGYAEPNCTTPLVPLKTVPPTPAPTPPLNPLLPLLFRVLNLTVPTSPQTPVTTSSAVSTEPLATTTINNTDVLVTTAATHTSEVPQVDTEAPVDTGFWRVVAVALVTAVVLGVLVIVAAVTFAYYQNRRDMQQQQQQQNRRAERVRVRRRRQST